MAVDLRTVNGFVAAGRPAGALLQSGRYDRRRRCRFSRRCGLLLEMAFEAKVGVALREQPLVYRAMRRMAAHTAFPNRFMLEDERAALRGVALETGFVVAEQRRAAALDALRDIRSAALDGIALVRVVTIGATDFAFQDRMMMRQLERRFHFGVALETGGWRFSRIHNTGEEGERWVARPTYRFDSI